MKNIMLKCCLIMVFLPIVTNAGCSFFEPLEYYDRTKPVKNWYVVRRYANGPESNTTCQILNYPKAPGSRTLYYADGTKLVVTGNGVPPEPGCSSGKLILKDVFPTNRPSVKYVTYTDYETIRVTRACYNDEDYLWIYSSKKRPCKKTREAIDAIIKEQKLDLKPIFKMCKCDIKEL